MAIIRKRSFFGWVGALSMTTVFALALSSCSSETTDIARDEALLPDTFFMPCFDDSHSGQKTVDLGIELLNFIGQREDNYLMSQSEQTVYEFFNMRRRSTGKETYGYACDDPSMLRRVGKAITLHKMFSRPSTGALGEINTMSLTELELASRIPDPSEYIVKLVAEIAFDLDRPKSPVARTVLASFGREIARPYAKTAFRKISNTSSLGTGFAQIAAAGGHPKAVPRVIEMMNEIMDNDRGALERSSGLRLCELAHAIYFSETESPTALIPVERFRARSVRDVIWSRPASQNCAVLGAMKRVGV